MASDTVDMQISIRGAAFTSDPDLIVFEGTTFSFPNANVFSAGLELIAGLNVIEVRSVSFSGAVSASARVEVTVVQDADIGLIGIPPTNVSVEQRNDAVKIQVEGVDDPRFQGVNFYASRFQGGGATGYLRVNLNTVTDFSVLQETQTIGTIDVENTVATNPDGTPAADPLYVQIKETQTRTSEAVEDLEDIVLTPELAAAITEQEQANLIKTDFVQSFEVPETALAIRTSITVASIISRPFYSFVHNRQFGPSNTPSTVPIGEFASTPTTEPLFYVASAVFFDETRQVEVESSFSPEVVAQPVLILENVGTFPAPSRLQVVQDIISSLVRTTPALAVQPGAVIRDTVVDPTSDEVMRLRLLVDFLYRTQAFDTLLQIDGVQSDGTSVPVSRSPYKQALARVFDLSAPNDIQTIIDTSFEQLASRNNVFRRVGSRARGFVTFFTRTRPTATIFIPLGTIVASGSVQFATTSDASIPINNVAAFFNPTTGFFQVDVPVQAVQPGSVGNLGAGQIRSLVSGPFGLSVTNRNATFGGSNRETNLALSIRARGALAAVDSGTERGTLQTAASVPGVEDVRVVSPSDSLMQRDFDTDYNKHVGGKVDVWERGTSTGTVTDTFAFTFEVADDVQFVIIGNPLDLVFRALDTNLSPSNPIAEMLDAPDLGVGFRNATIGVFFDLTDVKILDYRTIQLSSAVVQPIVTLGNIILGDYRYVTSTKFVFTRQPVQSVDGVTGQISGDLPADNFVFVQPDDPLLEGRSVKAQSYIDIIQTDGIPSGDPVVVTNEQHLLLGQFNEFLSNLGANPLTIQVTNTSGTVLYRGPDDPSGVSDYVIVPGTQITAAALRRTTNSQITSGETVLVSYQHAENFTVTYTTNFVVPTLQDALDARKHITADVLAKEAVSAPIDITTTIVTRTGFQTSTVDTSVRTNLTAFLRALPLGGAVRQSDIIAVIDDTQGVSYVENPPTKLARSAGSLVVRESVPSDSGAVEVLLGSSAVPYSDTTTKTWILEDALNNPTLTGGGDGTQFAGVFQDDRPMTLQTTSPETLFHSAGRAYIIGNEGLSIPNYSDDQTIVANFPAANTQVEIEAIRQQLTANRILVSLAAADRPDLHSYTVTYQVAFTENRVQDVEAGELEFFDVGNFIFTYVEDRRG
jgi:hypothetical protein